MGPLQSPLGGKSENTVSSAIQKVSVYRSPDLFALPASPRAYVGIRRPPWPPTSYERFRSRPPRPWAGGEYPPVVIKVGGAPGRAEFRRDRLPRLPPRLYGYSVHGPVVPVPVVGTVGLISLIILKHSKYPCRSPRPYPAILLWTPKILSQASCSLLTLSLSPGSGYPSHPSVNMSTKTWTPLPESLAMVPAMATSSSGCAPHTSTYVSTGEELGNHYVDDLHPIFRHSSKVSSL